MNRNHQKKKELERYPIHRQIKIAGIESQKKKKLANVNNNQSVLCKILVLKIKLIPSHSGKY